MPRRTDETQRAAIGNQTGGRVGFFLETDDFAADHAGYVARGVKFLEAPRHEPYGSVAVFEDPFGNQMGPDRTQGLTSQTGRVSVNLRFLPETKPTGDLT